MSQTTLNGQNIENNCAGINKKKSVQRLKRRVLGDIHNVVHLKCGEPVLKKSYVSEPEKVTVKPDQYETSLVDLVDYAEDIMNYLRTIETKFAVRNNHLEGKEITGKMRCILIDWLVEIYSHYNLLQDTFHLSVYLIDKYLESKCVTKENAQTIGLVGIYIATKYEEDEHLETSDILDCCAYGETAKVILETEIKMLENVDYRLGYPVPIVFVKRYVKIENASDQESKLAEYFIDMAIMVYDFCSLRPSILAAAAVYLAFCTAREKVSKDFWSRNLVNYSTYEIADFQHIVVALASSIIKQSKWKLKNLRKKYSATIFHNVSTLVSVQLEKFTQFLT